MKSFTKMLATLSSGIIALGAAATAKPLAEGAQIPAVTQKNQNGQEVNLAEAGAAGYTLVYFYPKADTPGCTKQACSLRDAYQTLTDKGVKVFGVSMDAVEKQKAFQEKYKLPFELLADTDGVVADAFDVPRIGGFTKRQAFLFEDGKLVWRDLSASTDKQAEDILKVIAKN